jgi:hypothetical protein
MEVGDLVKFNDVSSFADRGHGSFPQLNGSTALIVSHDVDSNGAESVLVLMNGTLGKWHPSYFKEVVNATR